MEDEVDKVRRDEQERFRRRDFDGRPEFLWVWA